jgi:hypothetical protein
MEVSENTFDPVSSVLLTVFSFHHLQQLQQQ